MPSGKFYFDANAGKENLENSSNAITVDLLPLLKPVSEETAASGSRESLGSGSGIFDLDM
jgi:hypothetical protein